MERPGGCPSQSIWERFEAKFVLESRDPTMDECWIWTASVKSGSRPYGFFDSGLAHRRSYEWWVGPIPFEYDVHHICNQPACVNPEHLEATTRHNNLMWSEGITSKNAKKDHCPKGHEYSGINNQGRRICRICQNEALKRSRAKGLSR